MIQDDGRWITAKDAVKKIITAKDAVKKIVTAKASRRFLAIWKPTELWIMITNTSRSPGRSRTVLGKKPNAILATSEKVVFFAPRNSG